MTAENKVVRERRNFPRIAKVIPVSIRPLYNTERGFDLERQEIRGQVCNISEGGIQIEPVDSNFRRLTESKWINEKVILELALPDSIEHVVLYGHLAWIFSNEKPRAGIAFGDLNDIQRQQLYSFLNGVVAFDSLMWKDDLFRIVRNNGKQTAEHNVETEILTYYNRKGKKIVASFDHLKKGPNCCPFIVIPPSYGETKRDSITVAYYLVVNGFNVIRYDCTNHVGESEGEMVNFTLSSAKDDL